MSAWILEGLTHLLSLLYHFHPDRWDNWAVFCPRAGSSGIARHTPTRRSTGSVPTPLPTFTLSAFCIFVKQLHFFPRHDMPLTFFMPSWGSLSVDGPCVWDHLSLSQVHVPCPVCCLSKWLASCLWASLLCLSGARCGDKKALVSLCFQHNLLNHLSGCPVQWPRRPRATSLSLSCPPGAWWAHVLCFHTARHSRVSSVNSSGPDTGTHPSPPD